ncbi:MAG: transcriptional repressor [Actinobacteria bacterium]|nr:transcriptional repressor [Actinomycetota bacterium]
MTTELDATAAARLRDADQRYTTSRRQIVGILAEAGRPLTIAEVQAASGGLPQSSAYRNLAVLEQAGVVRRVLATDEFARFELAEDLTEHHHHLVCTRCGSVLDFTMSSALEEALERTARTVRARTGFTVQAHRLDLTGVCADCAD